MWRGAMRTSKFQVQVHAENCVGCLVCQVRCSLRFTRSFNPLESRLVVQRVDGQRIFDVSLTPECDHCGLCARDCVYGALVLGKRGES